MFTHTDSPARQMGTFGSVSGAPTPAGTYPAYVTCAAGRPDHGSDGAYPAWPAFSMEALCYVDGNCSSAFAMMSTFAENTYEGPFGQVRGEPQSSYLIVWFART